MCTPVVSDMAVLEPCFTQSPCRSCCICIDPFILDQSFLALLAFAMFSCRFCFLFCSRSLASIIFASFQESSALAMKSGVKARMMVVRKPQGSLAAHSTTYSAQPLKSIILRSEKRKKNMHQLQNNIKAVHHLNKSKVESNCSDSF